MVRIAIDIGGTFTDVVAETSEAISSIKVLTTPQAPDCAVWRPRPSVLRSLADKAKAVFSAQKAIAIKDDWGEKVQVIRPDVNQDNARRVGLTQGDISRAIAGRFDGEVIGVYREGNELKEILVRPELSFRDDAARAPDVQIFSPATMRYVPVNQVVDGFDVILEESSDSTARSCLYDQGTGRPGTWRQRG